MKLAFSLFILCFISCLLLSCRKDSGSDSDSTPDENGNQQFSGGCALRTVGGPTCSNGPGPIAFVTGIIDDSATGICSGVFISPSKVLTDAHCLSLASTLAVIVDNKVLQVLNVATHPQFNGPGNFDVMVLTVPPQGDISPLPLLLSESVKVGDSFIIYGYGPDPSVARDQSKLPPLGSADLKISFISPDLLAIGAIRESGGSGGCAGDSGGPAIRKNRDGLHGIFGLVLGGDNNTCEAGTLNLYTNTQAASIASFILQAAPDADTI